MVVSGMGFGDGERFGTNGFWQYAFASTNIGLWFCLFARGGRNLRRGEFFTVLLNVNHMTRGKQFGSTYATL
jgi:hypothetical protein